MSFTFDTRKLLSTQASLALFLSPFKTPRYNLELFLFGIIANELQTTNQPLRLFAGFLGLSLFPVDLIWLIRYGHRQSFLIWTLTLVHMLLKIPTFYSTVVTLRERGDETYAQAPGIDVPFLASRGINLNTGSTQTVWQASDMEAAIPGGYNVPSDSQPGPGSAPTQPFGQGQGQRLGSAPSSNRPPVGSRTATGEGSYQPI
ncbi:hypothetical protein [Phaffia rhodozyma]|uniref:Uncharacterized protein n=1 Tax=Phaffia rhodozyma TaxID=264483 RepID=A0A0F7SXN9_PHARH|nr:hypothetical protein [Phaffia rhodozyma]